MIVVRPEFDDGISYDEMWEVARRDTINGAHFRLRLPFLAITLTRYRSKTTPYFQESAILTSDWRFYTHLLPGNIHNQQRYSRLSPKRWAGAGWNQRNTGFPDRSHVGERISPSEKIVRFRRGFRRNHSSGPPLHTIPPGVFAKTGGWRIPIGAQFGFCLGILVHRGLGKGRIGEAGSAGSRGF